MRTIASPKLKRRSTSHEMTTRGRSGHAGADRSRRLRPPYRQSQRDSLTARHGWFGRLALTHGLRADNPEPSNTAAWRNAPNVPRLRCGERDRHRRARSSALCLMVLGDRAGRDWDDCTFSISASPTHRETAYLEAFRGLHGRVSSSSVSACGRCWPSRRSRGHSSATVLLPIVLVWPMIRGESWPEVKQHFGWHRGRRVLDGDGRRHRDVRGVHSVARGLAVW